jgi:cyclophilin family peptidyl-prolyl cis-trans isomerase
MRAWSGLLASWMLIAAAGCDGGTSSNGTGGGGTGGGPTDPAIAMIAAQIAAASVDKTSASWRTSLPRPTLVIFTPERRYVWTLVTSKGEMRLELLPGVAPMHVTSTIYLTMLGFYETLTFHRIIKGFMAQGGDPLGNGRGGPGYAFNVELTPAVRHDARGVLSMANAGANTEGSQFFVTFGPQPALDGKYTVFGSLVSGLDALSAIESAGTVGEGNPGLVTITSATIAVE